MKPVHYSGLNRHLRPMRNLKPHEAAPHIAALCTNPREGRRKLLGDATTVLASDAHKAIHMLVQGRDRATITPQACDQSVQSILNSMNPKNLYHLDVLCRGTTGKSLPATVQDFYSSRSLKGLSQKIKRQASKEPHGGHMVISDIDDTLGASLYDRSPFKTLYPGARRFMKMANMGRDGTGIRGHTHFVSARPAFLEPMLNTHQHLTKTKVPFASVLNSHIRDIYHGLFQPTNPMEPFKKRKIANIKLLMDRCPQSNVVLLGDSGQADYDVFKDLLEGPYAERISIALLHQIEGREKTIAPEMLKIKGYRNFGEAAKIMKQAGYFSNDQVRFIRTDLKLNQTASES